MQGTYLVFLFIFYFDTPNASDFEHPLSPQSDEFEALSPVTML